MKCFRGVILDPSLTVGSKYLTAGSMGGGREDRSEIKGEERKRKVSSEHFMNSFQEKARPEQSDNILPDASH